MHGGDRALEPLYTSDVVKQLNAAAKAALEGVETNPAASGTEDDQTLDTNTT